LRSRRAANLGGGADAFDCHGFDFVIGRRYRLPHQDRRALQATFSRNPEMLRYCLLPALGADSHRISLAEAMAQDAQGGAPSAGASDRRHEK